MWFVLFLACAKSPEPETTSSGTTSSSTEPAPQLLISGYTSEKVHIVDGRTGEPIGAIDDVPGAQSIHRGPDGVLHVVAEEAGEIARLDADLNRLPSFPAGVQGPTAAVFGPDGDLYVCGYGSHDVVRLDGATGAVLGTAVEAGLGGIAGPDAGMLFLEGGSLVVPGFDSNSLVAFDLAGGFTVLADADDGLSAPRGLVVHEGRLLVTSWRASEVMSFALDGSDGRVFAQVSGPTGITVHPETGEILVIDADNDVRRLDPSTGEDLGRLVKGKRAGVEGGNFLSWL